MRTIASEGTDRDVGPVSGRVGPPLSGRHVDPPGRPNRRPLGPVVLERLAVVAQRQPPIGTDHPPPGHAATLERHDLPDLARAADADDPWGGQTLEWSTSSPPPRGNFAEPVGEVTSATPLVVDEEGEA